jgi:butyrate kinase
MKILSVNPGGVSTKVAIYDGRTLLCADDIQHGEEELKGFQSVLEQFDFRYRVILDWLAEKGHEPAGLAACVGRGGLFKPLRAGTYLVNDAMLDDIRQGRTKADHPSNLGALLAHAIASPPGIPAMIVDPVSVDEFEPEARLSGWPSIERRSLLHALNVRATAYKLAERQGRPLAELNLVVAHLGSGFSICPMRRGRIVDVNNANDGGPFSPQRTGTLPVTQLVELAFSGQYPSAKALNGALTKKGGLTAYLGTHDMREVDKRIEAGDETAQRVFRAMVWQIVKEVGAMSAILEGDVDAIVVTGGLAYSSRLREELSRRLSWIAPVEVFPGENELESLAMGALRVLENREAALEY